MIFRFFISKISLRHVGWVDEQFCLANFSVPIRIWFGIFYLLNIANSFPNRIGFGSAFFSGLKYCFLFPNRIQFGSENFIEFCKIFSEPNWNRFGNGHWIKCSCTAHKLSKERNLISMLSCCTKIRIGSFGLQRWGQEWARRPET